MPPALISCLAGTRGCPAHLPITASGRCFREKHDSLDAHAAGPMPLPEFKKTKERASENIPDMVKGPASLFSSEPPPKKTAVKKFAARRRFFFSRRPPAKSTISTYFGVFFPGASPNTGRHLFVICRHLSRQNGHAPYCTLRWNFFPHRHAVLNLTARYRSERR